MDHRFVTEGLYLMSDSQEFEIVLDDLKLIVSASPEVHYTTGYELPFYVSEIEDIHIVSQCDHIPVDLKYLKTYRPDLIEKIEKRLPESHYWERYFEETKE